MTSFVMTPFKFTLFFSIQKSTEQYKRSASSSGSSGSSGSDAKLAFLKSKFDSVRLSVQEAHVSIHRNLGGGSQGRCNPYVTMGVVPGGPHLPQQIKFRTATQQRTLFPL